MTAELDYRDYWERAFTFDRYVANEVETNRSLWEAVYKKSRTPKSAIRRAAEIGGRWKLLVLSEDWCGDAVNTLPVVARFADEVGWDFRVLSRDENLDLMDAHLTNGRSRSIPDPSSGSGTLLKTARLRFDAASRSSSGAYLSA